MRPLTLLAGVAVLLCAVTGPSHAKGPLAQSVDGDYDVNLTPAPPAVDRIQLGVTKRGSSRYVLIRPPGRDEFSLMLENLRTGNLRPSTHKVVLSPQQAMQTALRSRVKDFAQSDRTAHLLPGGMMQLGRHQIRAHYHGLSQRGTEHIVELRPTSTSGKRPDTIFYNISIATGKRSANFWVPSYGRFRGKVLGHWAPGRKQPSPFNRKTSR